MKHATVIAAALAEAGVRGAIESTQPLSGGCIHTVLQLQLASGSSVVAKIAPRSQHRLLEEERDGLLALARTCTVLVPEPIALIERESASVLLTTFLAPRPATDAAWTVFGEQLAMLHAADVGHRYGFHGDNHIGATPQRNVWHNDWIEFNRHCRLGFQLDCARRHNLLTPDEAKRIERVMQRLGELIPRHPRPALLHGDLWSGNALATVDGHGASAIAVIDPACSIGDGWADLAMMQLFGGFPRNCLDSYDSNVTDHTQRDSRIAVYQLYHVLNHVNLFGRGYLAQAMSLARALGG